MNEQPKIPGYRSATLDAHGNIAQADVIAVRTVCGKTHYVDREQLAGVRLRLTQYRKDGTLLGRFSYRGRSFTHATPLHRGLIMNEAQEVAIALLPAWRGYQRDMLNCCPLHECELFEARHFVVSKMPGESYTVTDNVADALYKLGRMV